MRDSFEYLEILFDAFAANPADQAQLEARPQAPCPLGNRERRLTSRGGDRGGLLVRLEIQQQQRALGQQRAAAHRAQVVEQWQQHQCQVAPAGQHAFHVARQLHHGAHQRVQSFRLVFLRSRRQQVVSDLLHFLGQQRGAENLQQTQHTLHLVQVGDAALQQHHIFRLFDIGLERRTRLAERVVQLATD
jgi:hypothetical protein